KRQVLGGGALRHKTTGEARFMLGRLDLDTAAPQAEEVEIDFLVHGITPHPTRRREIVMFEKHGPGCAVFDLEAREVVRTVACAPHRQFYGHGAYSRDGSLLYCTESDPRDGRRGYITVRDGRTFETLGDFPSHGLAPHDCQFAKDGTTLVVANGGSGAGRDEDLPGVAFVDVRDGKLLDVLPVPSAHINAGHLDLTEAGDLALVSAPRDGYDPARACGGVSLRAAGAALTTVREPEAIVTKLLGETLSLAIHPGTRVVGATTPLGNFVTFWNLDTGALVGKLRVPNPRGIALSLSGEEFLINFGAPPRVARVHAQTLRPVDAAGNQRGYLSMVSGSHIYVDDASSIAAE
ncbi:MAG: DUF1513 domain-containing protein, partial [Nannocystaceae bacterium]|nr:DUF1513 domain-containing protein [Nannocystaceae bacterium]